MFEQKSNIILIGMPGSGKSTIGRRLARHFVLDYIDGDDLIEERMNMPIQDVVDRLGIKRFLEVEAEVLRKLDLKQTVISTGGSAIYSREAIEHLRKDGVMIYLRISAKTMQQRVGHKPQRGLAKYPAHSLQRLYTDRAERYPQSADVIFDNDLPFTQLRADKLIDQLRGFHV